MRQLFRRLRTCEAGAGLVEYALLTAVVTLGLVGVLRVFRNAVGGLTHRTAVNVSTQTGGRYGAGGAAGWAPGGPTAHRPATPDPDSSSAQPDSPAAGGGATTAFRFAIP